MDPLRASRWSDLASRFARNTIASDPPAADACLHLTVRDAGVASREWVPGVGLSSMRERAAEIGETGSR